MAAAIIQDGEQALDIDRGLRTLLERESMAYTLLNANMKAVNTFATALVQ